MTTHRFFVLLPAIIIAAGALLQPARGNDEERIDAAPGAAGRRQDDEETGGSAKGRFRKKVSRRVTSVEEVAEEMSPQEVADINRYRELVQAAKGSGSGAEWQKAREELRKGLDELFQRDLERREKVVSDAEARVKKIREQLERRKTSRAEIIELRVQTIENEAAGLEFGVPFNVSIAATSNSSGMGAVGGVIHFTPPQPSTPAVPIVGSPIGSPVPPMLPAAPSTEPAAGGMTFGSKQPPQLRGSSGTTPARASSKRSGKRDDDRPVAGARRESLNAKGEESKGTISTQERVRILIRNLDHQQESRSIFAADELGKLGIEAASALDALTNRINYPPGAAKSPSDAQRAAYRRAKEKIQKAIDDDDAKKLGIEPKPEPVVPETPLP